MFSNPAEANIPLKVQGKPGTEGDIIDREILTLECATVAFDYFVGSMLHHFPIVVFPSDATAVSVRKSKPVLFLAILNAASGTFESRDLQRTINYELMKVMSDKILMIGEKSLELIQAVQLMMVWYYPPGKFEELKHYQYVCLIRASSLN